MFGIEPTASTTCEPSTTRPSLQSTRTVSPLRTMFDARAPLSSVHPALEERLLEHRRDLGVLHRQHLLARDDERHLRPERVEHVGELHPGDPRPDDHDVRRDLGRWVRLTGREHALAVDRREVGYPRPGAGGDDDVVGFELLDAGRGLDRDLVRALEPGRSRGSAARPATRAGGGSTGAAGLDRLHPLAERLDVEGALGLQAHGVRAASARTARRRSRSSPSTGCSPRGVPHRRRCRARRASPRRRAWPRPWRTCSHRDRRR